MFSLAAIVAWPFYGKHHSDIFLAQKKTFHNGSSILQYKRGRSCSSLKRKKQKHSVHRHQSGEWRLPPAGCEASGRGRPVLLQHALDGLVGWFIVQMLGRVPAATGRATSESQQTEEVFRCFNSLRQGSCVFICLSVRKSARYWIKTNRDIQTIGVKWRTTWWRPSWMYFRCRT